MAEAKVMYDYDAVQEDELNLKKGQTITGIYVMEDGWWEGEVNGKRGLFPDNFVELLTKDKPVPVKGQAPAVPSAASPASTTAPTATSQATPAPTAPATVNGDSQDVARRDGSDKSKTLRAKVVFSYHPQNEDEIGLAVGEVVDVTGQPEEGWWEGTVRGHSGLFPSNFVALMEGEGAGAGAGAAEKENGASTREPAPSPQEAPRKVPEKVRNIGVGYGNIFADGVVKLKKTPGAASGGGGGGGGGGGKKAPPTAPNELAQKRLSLKRPDSVAVPKPPGHAEVRPRPEPKKEPRKEPKKEEKEDAKATAQVEDEEIDEIIRERARAIFPYEAQHSDELELKDGDVVTILDKEAGDNGWWFGEVDGRKGVFPDNFVTMLPPEKVVKKKPPAALPNRPLPPGGKPAMPKPPPPPQDGPAQAQPRRPSAPLDPAPPKMEQPARKPQPTAAPKPALPAPIKKPKAKPPPPKPSGLPSEREEGPPPVVLRHRPAPEESKEPAVEGSLEDIKSDSGQKLTHITLSRPKNANRRPPSVFGGQGVNLMEARDKLKRHEESEKKSSDVTDGPLPSPSPSPSPSSSSSFTVLSSPTSPPESSQPPWVRELKARSIRRSSPLTEKPQAPLENGTAAPPPRPKFSPIGPTPAAAASSSPAPSAHQAAPATKKSTEISPAQSPAASRPASQACEASGPASAPAPAPASASGTNEQVEELKKAVKTLQDQMASMRSEFKKEVVNLMSEVDEEKKHRMAMQVELDRIKKLVREKN